MKTTLFILMMLLSVTVMSQSDTIYSTKTMSQGGLRYDDGNPIRHGNKDITDYYGNYSAIPVMDIVDNHSYLNLRREYKEYCNQEVMEVDTFLCLVFNAPFMDLKDTICGSREFLEDFIGYRREYLDGTVIINTESFDRIDTTYAKIETESPEGFWKWVDENYLK